MTLDATERGLERLVVAQMTGRTQQDVIDLEGTTADELHEQAAQLLNPTDWRLGHPADYDRRFCLDFHQLAAFLKDTQPAVADAVTVDRDTPARVAFLQRLHSELERRGVVDVLRRGISHLGNAQIDLYYGRPSTGNPQAAALHAKNRFVVTRQLKYSQDATKRALDLGLFVNGLPIATAELKNSLTRQTVQDAIQQYQTDRDPKEPLFRMGRCAVHFALDDSLVRMCTELKGTSSWFLPFDKGVNDGAGNPPNPNGLKTDYLWREVLRPDSLANILENYAQIVEEKDRKTGRKKRKAIWPRYHQLTCVRALLADAGTHGASQRYLVQHSAGSGKSNSIAWLAHQLVGLQHGPGNSFDTVIVVTDRRNLDEQIRETVKGFAQVSQIVAPVTDNSQQLGKFLEEGRKIVITTIQKFSYIVDAISDDHRTRKFAIIVDEAHSSQTGKSAAALAGAITGDVDVEDNPEDVVNAALEERMRSRKLPSNASYFAFTATPKAKTLELFGMPDGVDEEGRPRRRPFHSYTMKQAIEEGFIKDVLKSYTPISSYFSLLKTVEDDPEFDAKKAQARLRRFVEGQDHAIRTKAEIMVDHFHQKVRSLVGGQARAMVVTNGVERAIQYFHTIREVLRERQSPYDAIVAFSDKVINGEKVTEASLNKFASGDIPDTFSDEKQLYRFLICADKFQTGFDEPLLQTMYVDKTLSGVQAVQTLSRLNRAHPRKRDVFVLDFMNDTDAIQASFARYYRTTVLSGETDPNRLHDLKHEVEAADLFTPDEVEAVVAAFLGGHSREQLDPLLDVVTARYEEIDDETKVAFKATAKDYVRTYDFLAAVLPYTNAEWERLSIMLTLLVPKLRTPQSDDHTAGLLDNVDLESYRIEKKAEMSIALPDGESGIEPLAGAPGAGPGDPTMAPLSTIIRTFNERWGAEFTDADRVIQHINDTITPAVVNTSSVQDALRNTPENARAVLLHILGKVVSDDIRNGTELYKTYTENEGFRDWLVAHMFRQAAASRPAA